MPKTGGEPATLYGNLPGSGPDESDPECRYRPFGTLSYGERTRVMLAALFSAENEFLLIDEPTNSSGHTGREAVKQYLAAKKGFLLASHDRDLLDAVCNHKLVLNRKTIEVQAANFSTWWENKEHSDAFARAGNGSILHVLRIYEEGLSRICFFFVCAFAKILPRQFVMPQIVRINSA